MSVAPRSIGRRWLRSVLALLAAGAGVWIAAPAWASAQNATPVYAYYYIWFNTSSWNRAKVDYPLLGRYSSDEVSIMRAHIRMARKAGIQGFIVSWKSTPVLDSRLAKLVAVAHRHRFKLAVIYQGLDFERRPLPVARVESDFDLFLRRYARSPVFSGFGKPVIIWSGTWEFTPEQIRRVTARLRDRLRILASEHNSRDYLAKAALFDGNAYYWSSVNPDTYPDYPGKLQGMSRAVHAHGGLWFAPAAPGFDARLIGGRTVVERKDGETLRRQLDVAQGSEPDAIGLISWNEFSENTHVEPSRKHGTSALEVLADVRGASFEAEDAPDSSEAVTGGESGPPALWVLVGFIVVLLASAALVWRRRPRPMPDDTALPGRQGDVGAR